MVDRDGTIIADRHYLNDPDGVVLLPGAADAIRRLSAAGYPSIVCTNQSGIARGAISLAQYHTVRQRLDALLAAEGAELRDTFACPHHPEVHGPCACRKPGLALYERAAVVHDLDLSRCLFIGDRARDVTPSLAWHARGVLVRSTNTREEDVALATEANIPVVPSLADAVALLLSAP
jgi:histidinol-phosphate phosphatase family protein